MSENVKEKKPNIFKRMGKYFKSLRSEMKKVYWPTKKQLISSTVSVVVFCIIIGVIIALLDMLVGKLIISELLKL